MQTKGMKSTRYFSYKLQNFNSSAWFKCTLTLHRPTSASRVCTGCQASSEVQCGQNRSQQHKLRNTKRERALVMTPSVEGLRPAPERLKGTVPNFGLFFRKKMQKVSYSYPFSPPCIPPMYSIFITIGALKKEKKVKNKNAPTYSLI